jgi:hypothetical protein
MGTSFSEADHDLHAAVMQVAGMGVALTAVSDDGDSFFLDVFYICVFVVVNLRQNFSPYL